MEKGHTTPAVEAAVPSGAMGVLRRAGRMLVFIFSAGFLCPNVWVEGMDLSEIQGKSEGDLYKAKKK